MKKLMAITFALSLIAVSSMAFAQTGVAEQYDFGMFGDEAGTMTSVAAAAFTPFNFYAIGFDLDGQVKGFEVTVGVPAGLTVLTRTIAGPGPINLGDGPDEFIVGTGGCVEGMGAFVMVAYNGGYFVPTVPSDAAVCVAGTTPSSFPGGTPGYLQCDGTLVPAGVAENGQDVYPNGCMIINPTDVPPVAVEGASFGDLKARF